MQSVNSQLLTTVRLNARPQLFSLLPLKVKDWMVVYKNISCNPFWYFNSLLYQIGNSITIAEPMHYFLCLRGVWRELSHASLVGEKTDLHHQHDGVEGDQSHDGILKRRRHHKFPHFVLEGLLVLWHVSRQRLGIDGKVNTSPLRVEKTKQNRSGKKTLWCNNFISFIREKNSKFLK